MLTFHICLWGCVATLCSTLSMLKVGLWLVHCGIPNPAHMASYTVGIQCSLDEWMYKFNLQNNSWSRYEFYPHFTDEKTKAQEGKINKRWSSDEKKNQTGKCSSGITQHAQTPLLTYACLSPLTGTHETYGAPILCTTASQNLGTE